MDLKPGHHPGTMRPDLRSERLHSTEHPHWSLSVAWRPGRFDSMSTAPTEGYPIMHIRGRDENGVLLEPMHYACGDGDGLMPSFDGWFVPDGSGRGFREAHPVEWQPLSASPVDPDQAGPGQK